MSEGGLPSEESDAIEEKKTLPSVLLANVQSLDNKMDKLLGRLNYQRDIKNCNILCFTESWLNYDNINIHLAGYMLLYRKVRTAASGKTRGGGLCIFVNNSCLRKSRAIELLLYFCLK